MKKIKLLLITVCMGILPLSQIFAGTPGSDKARGLFFSLGVGGRQPIGNFASTSRLGVGGEFELSYTDNEYLPVFLFGKIGVEHYPGSYEYYQKSDYSNYAVTIVPLSFGARMYFPPIAENFVLVMPHLEASVKFALYEKLHQYQFASGLPNYTDDGSMFGVSVGGGLSMFIMEINALYTYYQSYQNISLDLKVRLPLFISI
ncbi:MAG: hypothetical protein LWX56_03190 [Ignavibacteria bacterium]|nr:hypothetical protein [Ignavibacteria bacterium]